MRKRLLFVIILLSALKSYGQDHLYSQFFNSPLYLNPALTGQFQADLRLSLIYRNQFTSVPGSFSYISASVDYNIPKFGGGIGLLVTRSSEGTAYLTKNNISGIYAYSVGSDAFVLSFGLQAGITNRSLDFSKLVFGDQIDPRLGFIPGSTSAIETPAFNNRFYFDSGVGINLTAGEFNIGGAMQHLNKPDESFTGTPAKLPVRATAHISYRWNLSSREDNIDEDDRSYFIPSVVVYKQAAAQAVNVGLQFKRKGVNAGLWYRSSGFGTPNALVVSLIFDLFINKQGGEKIRLGFSHDAPTSGLNYGNTSGTTEGSIGYETTLPSRVDTYHKFEGLRRCYDFF